MLCASVINIPIFVPFKFDCHSSLPASRPLLAVRCGDHAIPSILNNTPRMPLNHSPRKAVALASGDERSSSRLRSSNQPQLTRRVFFCGVVVENAGHGQELPPGVLPFGGPHTREFTRQQTCRTSLQVWVTQSTWSLKQAKRYQIPTLLPICYKR